MMKIKFKDYDELTEKAIEMLDELFGDDIADVTFVCKYNHARKILESLIKKDCKIENITLYSTDFHDAYYYDEYYCGILKNDNNIELWCEPAKRNNEYITDNPKISFIIGNCSSQCVAAVNPKIKFIAELDEEFEKDEKAKEESTDITNDAVHVAKDADGKPIGFSFSYYSGDFKSIEDIAIKYIAEELGIEL